MADLEDAHRHFVAFVRTGEAQHMAAVFDRTAPHLLLLAMHLTRDRATAEDLLQTTFLQAIRDAARFDQRQSLLPWLTSILVHRAHDHRRRSALRRAEPIEEAASVPSPEPDPAQRLLEEEALAHATRALERLTEPYRHVLVLRLVHGLQAKDIGHALGRSPGTVRMQLKRGLELLRRALPKGLTVPAALVLGAGRGLAAVRADVVAAAGASRAAAGASGVLAATAAGGLVMQKIVWAAGVAFAATLLWLFVTPPAPVTGPGTPAAKGHAGALAASIGEHGAPLAGASRTVAGAANGRSVAPPPADARAITIRGRCVAEESGAPLAGCDVRAQRYHRKGWRPPRVEWQDPPPQVTAADGRFAFRLQPDPDLGVDVFFDAPGRVPLGGGWESLRPGLDLDVGDVRLATAVPLRARIVDQDGRGLTGMKLAFRQPERGGSPPWFTDGTAGFCVSGENGYLPELRLRPGAYRVQHDDVAMVPYRFRGPRQLDVAAGLRGLEAVFTFERAAPSELIAGRVLDTAGAPVAGLELHVREDGEQGCRPVHTDAAGAFVSPPLPADGRRYRVQLRDDEQRYALESKPEPYPPGTADLQLRVRAMPAAPFRLHVVDGRTGAPLERFAFRLEPRRDVAFGTAALRSKELPPFERHNGGVAVIPSVYPGTHWLSVWADDDALAPRTLQRVEIGEQQGSLSVSMLPWSRVEVRVVEAGGRPAPGLTVQVVRYASQADWPKQVGAVTPLGRETSGSYAMAVIREMPSDRNGCAVLQASPYSEDDLLLRAVGPRHVTTIADDVEDDVRRGHCTLVVQAAARLVGVLGPRCLIEATARLSPFGEQQGRIEAMRVELAHPENRDKVAREPSRPEVLLYARTTDGRRGTPAVRATVDANGGFAIDSVPPGSYAVWVRAIRQCGARDAGVHVELAAGAEEQIELRLPELMPARVHGAVQLDGLETGSRLELASAHEWLDVDLNAEGEFTIDGCLGGDYVALIRPRGPDAHRRLPWFADEVLRVQPGRTVERMVRFTPRRVLVRVVHADGVTPAADQALKLRWLEQPFLDDSLWFRREWRTDARGELRLDPAPPGRLEVRAVLADGQEVVLGVQEGRVPFFQLPPPGR